MKSKKKESNKNREIKRKDFKWKNPVIIKKTNINIRRSKETATGSPTNNGKLA